MKTTHLLGIPLLVILVFFAYVSLETTINTAFYQPSEETENDALQSESSQSASFIQSHPAAELEETVSLIPEIEEGIDYYQIAMKAVVDQDNETAADLLKKAIIAKPNHSESRKQLRLLYTKMYEVDELITFYEALIEELPNEANYPASLGTIYMTAKKDQENARNYFNLALEIDPKNETALYNLKLLD